MKVELTQALNEQVKNELYSAYLYLAMAAYCESKQLPGFAHWMKVQVKEETAHGMRIFNYLIERGQRVTLEAIAQPPDDFSSAAGVFEQTLNHEKKVTKLIAGLYELAEKSGDRPAQDFLQWFVNEQVEEEESATKILEKIKATNQVRDAIIVLDKELAKRKG